MTTENENPLDYTGKDLPPFDFSEPDVLLRVLVDKANRAGLEMGVTLTLGGTLVAGDLVSGSTWFEGFASKIQATGTGSREYSDMMADIMREWDERRYSEISSETTPESNDDRPLMPTYIHLRDARIMDPSRNRVPTEGAWLRMRLTTVGGFMLGRIGSLE